MKLSWAVTSVTRVVTSITINVTGISKVITLVIFDVWGMLILAQITFFRCWKSSYASKENSGFDTTPEWSLISAGCQYGNSFMSLLSPWILSWPLDFWKICTCVLETRSWYGAGNIGDGGGGGGGSSSSSSSSNSSSSSSSSSSKGLLTGHTILNIKEEVRKD